jgi:hypothetical protein
MKDKLRRIREDILAAVTLLQDLKNEDRIPTEEEANDLCEYLEGGV